MARETTTQKEIKQHHSMSKQVLEKHLPIFKRFDDLSRSELPSEANWPYNSRVFDPRVHTVLMNKTSRILANKPRGRVLPREGGDVASAQIVNELLSFQWDMANHFNGTMLEKWILMDQWARKYGAAFALVNWHRVYTPNSDSVEFDGPEMKVYRNVDVLYDPNATSIEDAKWMQLIDYTTLGALKNTSYKDGRPVFKNLGKLEKSLKDSGPSSRPRQFESRNLQIWGLEDKTGKDEAFQHVKIVTEYRKDKWITFAPDHDYQIIREIDNPYEHGEIPIVMLRYYPLGDTLYGVSEVEPIEKLQKAINALINQYTDLVNINLYPPVHVNPTEVRMHTLEWGPGKFWEMDRPGESVQRMQGMETGIATFTQTYSFLVASLNNAVGEQSVGTSNLGIFNPEKTATEVADIASIRNARDVLNGHFLAEALKRQMMMWIEMNKQFLDTPFVMRVVGKEAIEKFRESQLTDFGVTLSGEEPEPRFREVVEGELAEIEIIDDDLAGQYDYIPDVESMSFPNTKELTELRRVAIEFMLNPMVQEQLASQGIQPDVVTLIVDMLEDAGLKDARKFFEKAQGTTATGEETAEPMQPPQPGQAPPEEAGQSPIAGAPAPRGIFSQLLDRLRG